MAPNCVCVCPYTSIILRFLLSICLPSIFWCNGPLKAFLLLVHFCFPNDSKGKSEATYNLWFFGFLRCLRLGSRLAGRLSFVASWHWSRCRSSSASYTDSLDFRSLYMALLTFPLSSANRKEYISYRNISLVNVWLIRLKELRLQGIRNELLSVRSYSWLRRVNRSLDWRDQRDFRLWFLLSNVVKIGMLQSLLARESLAGVHFQQPYHQLQRVFRQLARVLLLQGLRFGDIGEFQSDESRILVEAFLLVESQPAEDLLNEVEHVHFGVAWK